MSQKIIEHDYLVIGAGSGGLLVAVGLQKLGKDVAVVSKNIGGDCTHYGCVPSKTLLHIAKEYHQSCDPIAKEKIKKNALKEVAKKVNFFAQEEKDLIKEERYINGSAGFIDQSTVKVKNGDERQHVRFKKKCIIATGSKPRKITIKGIPSEKLITNEDFFYLVSLPASITILGGGPIGAELATACAHLGITTYLVSNSYLAKEPEVIAQRSLESLKKIGVKYHPARPIELKDTVLTLDNNTNIPETEFYLSAVGRVPNTELDLEKADVAYDNTGINIDRNLITSNRNIFAIGDCTQSPQFTHLAANQGKFVIKKIAVPFAQNRQRSLPRVTFTSPSISSTGELEKTANSRLFELDLSRTDKGRTHYDRNSYGVVNIDVTSGRVIGASLFGDFGEDLINLFTLLIDEKIPVLTMTDFITPYPTYANIMHNLSLDFLTYLASNWKNHPVGSVLQLIKYAIK
ncbi:NAD(P)/FAD-dependent oxidoreductase [bacterium]|nr:NAD(P)/FAD-dependent oxidoreductase [bacterium]